MYEENYNFDRQTGHILLVANVSKEHIRKFHIPFIEYMKSKNWIIDVACRMDEPIPECNTAYDLPCDRNPFRGEIRKSVSVLTKILEENKYDVIICNTLTGSIIARLAKKALGRKSPKLFYINHGLHFFKGASISRWVMGYPLEKLLTPWTDVLVTINAADYQMVKKYLKPKAVEKIHGIGVNLERFRNCVLSSTEKTEFRHSMGIGDNDFVLSYVAEINDNKNQAMLLEVFHIVQQAIPNAKMLLIGPEHDDGKLRKFVESRGLARKVLFLGWRDNIPELLKISDLYVASSKSEGLGINLIEAMACDLPVVASNNRGHAEIIHHGQNGFIVEQDDVEEMAKYVLQLYENKNLRSSIIQQAQSDIAKYEVSSVVKEEERILNTYLSI